MYCSANTRNTHDNTHPQLSLHMWTNSEIALCWLHSNKPVNVFVNNQVAQIRKLAPKATWQHIPSAENSADIPSGGLTAADLLASDLYWYEPSVITADSYPEPYTAPGISSTSPHSHDHYYCSSTTVYTTTCRPGPTPLSTTPTSHSPTRPQGMLQVQGTDSPQLTIIGKRGLLTLVPGRASSIFRQRTCILAATSRTSTNSDQAAQTFSGPGSNHPLWGEA
jgi:hypothetical protein